ncbi:MAG: hypothetical protein P1T08_14445 [Acidimicrobiia bacterium]|nr:hypothetical protein [Acidimicrobiia bacterium]
MTFRSHPYPPPGHQVRLPTPIWTAALDEVRRYSHLGGTRDHPGSEGLVYLAGVPAAAGLVVTAVLRLQHEPQGDRVAPTREEVRWLMSTLRDRDEKLVAQFHTHRNGAFHSPGDDQMATSFHDGFLSIVAPKFAVGIHRLDQCEVHEYRKGYFYAMTTAEVESRITVHDIVVDRLPEMLQKEPDRWHRFVQRLNSIALRQR